MPPASLLFGLIETVARAVSFSKVTAAISTCIWFMSSPVCGARDVKYSTTAERTASWF